MKKQRKQILALLLAVCTLVTFAMPTVFATPAASEIQLADEGGETAERPADLVVDFATAFQNAGVANLTFLQNATTQLNNAYETNKWTVYCDDTGASIRPNSLYAGGRYREGYLEIKNNNVASYGATAMMPTVFVAPGTGEYKLSFTFGTVASGDKKGAEMGAYILPMPATDYTKYNVPGPNASGVLTKAAVQNPGNNGTVTADAKVKLKEGVEYILVFYVTSPDTAECYANFKSFSLNYVPSEQAVPADLTVDFATAFANAGVANLTFLQNAVSQMNNAYETNQWTFYCGGTDTSIRPNSLYAGGRYREGYLELMNNNIPSYGKTAMLPTVFKAPSTGEFRLSLEYGTVSSGDKKAAEMGAYILPMPATHYTKYNVPGPNDAKILAKAYTQAPVTSGTLTAENTVILEKGVEYILVFYATSSDETPSYANFKRFTLTFEKELSQPASELYNFYDADLGKGFVKLVDKTQELKDAFDADKGNWRFEAADSVYQFRPAGGNMFREDHGGLSYVTGASGANTTKFFAIRIKSPGEGKFDLTFTHGGHTSGAKKGSAYIVDAAVIDEALGENATAYAEAMAANAYEPGEGVYAAYTAAITQAIKGKKAAFTADYTAAGTAEARFAFEADKEYVVVFTSDVASDGGANLILVSLNAEYSANQEDEPEEPAGPAYTDGLYNFNDILLAGSTMADSQENLATMYEANQINWKYEAVGGGLQPSKIAYHSPTDSVRAISAKDWWLAVRIKAPSQDGQYSIQMTHGATGDGAPAGSIYVIPGDTPTNQIFKVASKKDPTMTADWNYGEKTSDSIKGRVTTAGIVNMKAGEEYIAVFLPTEKNTINGNACFYLGQLQLERTGDYVEDENSGDDVEGVEYEFYDWDNPGQYLNHYKTEEQLGKKIVHQQIAQKYAAGEMNWCYFGGNGYANFSSGTPYLNVGVAETYYYVLKIKAPGTGTYEITYNHLAMKDAGEGTTGGVYIVPYKEGMDNNTVRDEANFKKAVMTTSYYAERTTEVEVKGTYTAFQEGKEYLICFSVDDTNIAEVATLKAFPVSMVMKRVGEYVPEVEGSGAYGITYDLALPEFSGKRHDKDNVKETIAQRYENGIMNWKLENGVGYAQFYSKYTQFATGYGGLCWAIRIKAPGTGEYKVTLDYIQSFDTRAANVGKIYIKEAPEETIPSGSLNSHLVQLPIMELTYGCGGTRMQRVSDSGTYMFKEGKEYIVFFYGQDDMDSSNPNTTTFMYAERLVMQRIGEYVETEKALAEGGIVAENVLTQFKTEAYVLTEVNGHDYLAFCLFGGTMLIYDLDEWRLIDEVQIGIDSPHAITEDKDGNWWIGGGQYLYCYNPYTREGFMTGKVSSGGQCLNMFSDPEEPYVYYAVYSDNCVILYRINTQTLEFKGFNMDAWSRYSGPGGLIKGDYIYMTATGGTHNEVWKVDKHTGKIVDRLDVTSRTKGERYIYNMSALGDNHLLVFSDYGVTAVDTRDMSLLYDDAVGNLRGTTSRIASDPIDGKCYFVTNVEGLCYFDLETETFGTVGGDLANYKTGLRFTNMATIEDSRLTEESMVAFGGMSADGVNLFAINLETKSYIELIGLVEPSMGTGVNAHTLFKGEPGTNEIIYGPMYPDFPARVYNAATGELARTFWTKGQNDSCVWYNGKMYFGNYNNAILCEMNNGQPTQLFALNDRNFDQSRIHGICGGGNKVFIGAIPDNFVMGGVIAWYDLDSGLTYVVTGPNPEDVYYAKASQMMTTNEWYSVVTGELVNMADEWDNDNDGDGVYDHFKGPIPYQSIVHLNYSDGLLYGVSSLRAGSGAGETPNATSVIFIYDVENMKMLKTVDLADYIDGVPTKIRTIKSLDADPDISNKMWGMVSETLFSMTYDRDTNKVTIKEEISFNKTSISASSSGCTQISFDGDYMYALFGPIGGLLKINRYDTSDYKKVMGDFETTNQVPSSFILGDDGDIYYISTSSPHIYVLNADITDEERASAKVVQDAIDLIPENVTLADRSTIEAARAAWDAMPKANQPLVNNLKKLENAEIALLVLRIDALSDNITIEDEPELMAIRAEYMALDVSQRATIDFKKVSDAESKMSILRGIRTTNMIDSIGTVTLDKEQLIRDARASYMALSRYERTLVANIDTLNAAEAVLTGLILSRGEAEQVDKLIDEIGFVFFSDAKIKAAREAYEALSEQAKALVTKYDALVAAERLLIAEFVIAAVVVVAAIAVPVVIIGKKSAKKKAKTTEE